MMIDLKEIAQELDLSEQELWRQGIRALILEKIRLLQAEKQARCAKFGVNSLEEMDKLIRQGKVAEKDILEDFQNVDYLTARIKRLEQLLEAVQAILIKPKSLTQQNRGVVPPETSETTLDWREIKGLGKELWAGIEAQEYVNQLRDKG